jgi:hypothetical protein
LVQHRRIDEVLRNGHDTALNPALTVAAQAIRVADRIAKMELTMSS